MTRHITYLHKVSNMLGRKLRPSEYGKLGKAIKDYPDEVIDKSLAMCKKATGVTDLVSYFLYACSSFGNKKTEILKGLEDEFGQEI